MDTLNIPAIREAAAAFRERYQRIGSDDVFILLCDTCGMCHADDEQSLVESCDCGRFKQRMDDATPLDFGRDALKTVTTLAADVARLCDRVEELERMLKERQ
jgi:predicted  nucleic acid-binding Zn-ribbon protein